MLKIKLFCYLYINNVVYFTRAVPKVIPPILGCWPTTPEADGGGMGVEVEPPHQYFITFCCCITDGSKGAV